MKIRTSLKIALIISVTALAAVVYFRPAFPAADARMQGCVLTYWTLFCAAALIPGGLRKRWREYLLCALVLAAALLAAEASIRRFFPYRAMMRCRHQPSASYHHILPPGREMLSGFVDEEPVIVHTNRDGLRTDYTPQRFLTHKNRIVVLGDSFTIGPMVPQEAAFPQVAERLLRRHPQYGDTAVLNAGMASYSPFLERLLFAGALQKYRPTLVLLVLDATDIGDDIGYERLAVRAGGSVSFEPPGMAVTGYYGALYELCRPWADAVAENILYPRTLLAGNGRQDYDYYAFRVTVGGCTETNRFFIYRHPLSSTAPYFENTLGHISAIADRAHAAGARFVLVVAPRYHHWNPRECPDNWERHQYAADEPFQYEYFRFFDQIRDSAGFDIFSLLPAFRATDEFPLVFRHDPHWNTRGHAFVARAVTGYLIQNGLIE